MLNCPDERRTEAVYPERGSLLSLSFVEPNKPDEPTEPDPRHAPRNDFGRILFLLATYVEVIMLAEHRLTADSGGLNIKA
jgi:hypothetical protein